MQSRCDMRFWKSYSSRELEFGRAFREAIGCKIWTFIVGVVVNKIIYFI
jgi:hypothetical protein